MAKLKTRMKDWLLEYRKLGDSYDGAGWYWHYEDETDSWDYGSYQDRESAINDFKEMAEYRGFEVMKDE